MYVSALDIFLALQLEAQKIVILSMFLSLFRGKYHIRSPQCQQNSNMNYLCVGPYMCTYVFIKGLKHISHLIRANDLDLNTES